VRILPGVVGPGERERLDGRNRRTGTDAEPAGGPSRSSDEAPAMGVERRGRLIREGSWNNTPMMGLEELVSQPKSAGKPFAISKQAVLDAFRKVKANKGGPGVDGCTIEEFEADLRNKLYVMWNRMSSGSYFPPPVKLVEIPKPHGVGTRRLGVPTVADRIAQTVVAMELEKTVEPKFHPSSYGYRPRRSQLQAVGACRAQCFKRLWVWECDIEGFFDNVPHDLIIKAVEANTDEKWVVLYVTRWLTAPVQHPDGTLQQRDRGTPQGGLCSAEHKPPNAQCWIMRSVGPSGLVRVRPGVERCA
jgi:hypothetical protein